MPSTYLSLSLHSGGPANEYDGLPIFLKYVSLLSFNLHGSLPSTAFSLLLCKYVPLTFLHGLTSFKVTQNFRTQNVTILTIYSSELSKGPKKHVVAVKT